MKARSRRRRAVRYHPGTLLKIYIYGYLNRIQSSRRLERETQRNVELIWLTARLSPDFKTIADFRKDNGKPIRRVYREFVLFKAVNGRDRNFTKHKLKASTVVSLVSNFGFR